VQAPISPRHARYATGGYDLVLGDALSGRARVAPDRQGLSQVAFLFGSGAGPARAEFGVFDNWIHEPAYLCG